MKFCKNCVHWMDFPDKHKQMPAGKIKACTVMVKENGKYVPYKPTHGKRTPAKASCEKHRAKHEPYMKVKKRVRLDRKTGQALVDEQERRNLEDSIKCL